MANESNEPNKHLFPIEAAENDIRAAINALIDLTGLNTKQADLQGKCVTALLELQSGVLFELRKAVE